MTTKFNPGDKVYCINNNIITQVTIKKILIYNNSKIFYRFDNLNQEYELNESKVFQTKEDLIKSL